VHIWPVGLLSESDQNRDDHLFQVQRSRDRLQRRWFGGSATLRAATRAVLRATPATLLHSPALPTDSSRQRRPGREAEQQEKQKQRAVNHASRRISATSPDTSTNVADKVLKEKTPCFRTLNFKDLKALSDSTCSASKVRFHDISARCPPSIVKKPSSFISVEHTVTIAAPIGDVFERWQRIEDYARFMEGVREISWLDEKRFRLQSESGGELYESICEMVLKIPEKRLAWRTLSGADSSGAACFERAHDGGTTMTLKMRSDSGSGWQDSAQVAERLRGNLERFKALMEAEAPVAPEIATT
jgi:hypothetical protein